jgi:protein-tyrosine kinase
MTETPQHLVERAAQRLGGAIGQSDAPPDVTPRPPKPASEPPHRPAPGPALVVDMAALMRAGLQIGDSRRSRLSEEYQVFAAEVLRTRNAQPGIGQSGQPGGPARGNLVMITSARPGEGKSFTALNLAASLALTRRTPTVLIDGDPKRDSIAARLGLGDRRGLFELAADPSTRIHDLLVPTAIEGMQVLPVGTFAEDHGLSLQIANALGRLARQLPDQVLILDTPPCLATSDASTLSPHVSQIIMVVEAERTQRQELEQSLNLVAQCPNIVLMLNKMRPRVANAFGAYGYYGG